MSPEPFFHADKDFNHETLTGFCQGCPQTRPGAFCGARIQPDCLRIDTNGIVRVSLATTAQTWFNTLSQLGEVLHLTRNPVAVLGKLGPVPALEDWRNYVLPRDKAGQFAPNLAEYAGLWAMRDVSPMGVLHGLEARDVSGAAFERVVLPVGTRHELFEQFVTEYQSPPEAASHWFPLNHAWSTQRRAKLAGRIPWLRSRWIAGDPNVRRLTIRLVSKLLAAAAGEKLAIRTAFYHPALTRTLIWKPETSEGQASAEFFHGTGVALHLNRSAMAGVWLWTGQCACCAEQCWSIEVTDHRDQIGLAFMASDETGESAWRALIDSCLA